MRLYYSHDPNPRVAIAVARHLGSPVVFIQVSPRDLQNPRSADALGAVDPCTPVPMLIEESRTLWETDAIVCRLSMLARSDFWPTDERAPELQTWLSWGRGFMRAASAFHFHYAPHPGLADDPADAQLAQAAAAFHRFAGVLDEVLSRRPWLIGQRLTYADFRVATALPFAAVARLPVRGYPYILKWHERLCGIAAWANPWPEEPRRTGSASGLRRSVAMSHAVVDMPDEPAIARESEGLDWFQARHPRAETLGAELFGLPRHKQ